MGPRRWPTWALAVDLIFAGSGLAIAEEATFRILPERSEVAFDATYPLGDFTGSTNDARGEIRFDPTNLAHPVVARVEVNPSNLKTGIPGRDRDLRAYMETERFPSIQFVVKEVRAAQASLDEAEVAVVISGVMTLHGVERTVEFSGKARLQAGILRVAGSTALKMSDYGIKQPTKLFLRVGDDVRVRFRVQAART